MVLKGAFVSQRTFDDGSKYRSLSISSRSKLSGTGTTGEIALVKDADIPVAGERGF